MNYKRKKFEKKLEGHLTVFPVSIKFGMVSFELMEFMGGCFKLIFLLQNKSKKDGV